MRKNRIFAIGLLTAAVIGGAGCSAQPKSASAQEQTVESAGPAETEETTVIETVEGTIESLEETPAPVLSPVILQGPVTHTEDGRLSIDSQPESAPSENSSTGTYTGEVILNISDDTLILDAVNGYPVQPDDLEDGSTIYAYVGPAMTMSLPPITNAELILCQIPADFKVPDYVEIKSVVADAASGSAVLTTTDGVEFEISQDCQILPYLTRNIVTLSDLSGGKKCLIWSDDQNVASKIVLFASEEQ
ncbi:MAG TPA: hypothetical protein H9716_03975 [Candidatus Enterocloster faecavium]|uniref:Uncharacterized protein n=1 Tax=Candidatus Enterocloster faecavium TaxID=2838560 RepID=A0A9D2L6W2_9FIRM|nr:hypothetical protein [Candidatus Enterocloster faecavium]